MVSRVTSPSLIVTAGRPCGFQRDERRLNQESIRILRRVMAHARPQPVRISPSDAPVCDGNWRPRARRPASVEQPVAAGAAQRLAFGWRVSRFQTRKPEQDGGQFGDLSRESCRGPGRCGQFPVKCPMRTRPGMMAARYRFRPASRHGVRIGEGTARVT